MDDLQTDIAAISRIEVVPTILEVICASTGMGFAAVARVTDDRWIACAVRDDIAFGLLPGGELKVDTTICDEIRDSLTPVVIDDVPADEAFCNHPTPAMYGFRSYISVPILRKDGTFFGTLCAIDPRPASLRNARTLGMFKLFADLIGFHLDAQDRLMRSEAALLSERETAQLREQFIAVLGHDLRNPLASIDAGARMLGKGMVDERQLTILTLIRQSVARISGLIDNVLDLTRSRLGGGLKLRRRAETGLALILAQVVEELRSTWPERRIEASFDLPRPVDCDGPRLAQLLSNLLANALAHGSQAPVTVAASLAEGRFVLSVANQGEPIAPDVLGHLFEPFFRPASSTDKQGLGLGLYIASEIARAHGGSLSVTSAPEETRFTFEMPAA